MFFKALLTKVGREIVNLDTYYSCLFGQIQVNLRGV
jgi:hypothetical protein